MKKLFIFLIVGFFFTNGVRAQTVKPAVTDTAKAYRANDRLRNAGPKNGNKVDSSKKIKNTVLPVKDTTAGNKPKKQNR